MVYYCENLKAFANNTFRMKRLQTRLAQFPGETEGTMALVQSYGILVASSPVLAVHIAARVKCALSESLAEAELVVVHRVQSKVEGRFIHSDLKCNKSI